MKKIVKLIVVLLMSLPSLSVCAQQEVEMADGMRASGKIYVVVAIILVVMAGLIAYLVSIDRKVSRIEKKIAENTH